MGLREAFQGFRDGLRKNPTIPVAGSLQQAPAVPVHVATGIAGFGVAGTQEGIDVVDTLKLPTNANIPGSWTRGWLAPGKPFAQDVSYNQKEAETEPRSFQYVASVNSTITPRIAYGHMPFAELKAYATGIPDTALCINLATEELKSFIPTLVDDNDEKVEIPELEWMTQNPDRFNPWPVWLSRFIFNVMAYDAPAVYKIRQTTETDNEIKKTRHGFSRPTELVNDLDESGRATPHLEWCCKTCGTINKYVYTEDLRRAGSDRAGVRCRACSNLMTKRQYEEVTGTYIPDASKNRREAARYTKLYKNKTVRMRKVAGAPVVGLRIIDGSTIFALIDERGEQPAPPAPAFTQVIWGVPRMFMNTYQLWYRPRFMRADSPYGKTFIEDALPAVKLMAQLWDYELDKYQIGNIPEAAMTAPPEWKSVDQILKFEDTYNDRMSGNNQERAGRLRFFPYGMTQISTKELTFNRETYDAASNAIRIAAGIPKSEVGEAPEGMLGGKSYAEAMNSSFYRMFIAPLQTFIESLFNDVIKENGYDNVYFKLKFPAESIDPEKEEAKTLSRFAGGLITRNEGRNAIGMEELTDPELGNFIVTPGGKGAAGGDDGSGMGGLESLFGGGKPGNMKKPVDVLEDPIDVLKEPIAVKFMKAASPKLDDDKVIEAGEAIGVDWDKITIEQLTAGMQEELEHFGTAAHNLTDVAQIALDHLNEDPEYYDKLAAANIEKLAKTCGVDPRDDEYFGAPIAYGSDVEMPHQGANRSVIVGIGYIGQEPRPAVWKPADGEDSKLRDWVGGELYRRAEAAYLIDRELATDENHHLVPVTWVDDINGVKGSIQHYVKGRDDRHEVNTYDQDYVEQAAVFDYITGQVDRVNKNWLTHPDDEKRPVLIDNDLSFPVKSDTVLRSTFVDAVRGRELSTKLLDSVYLIIGNHDLWHDLENALGSEAAVQNALKRATDIYKQRRIPEVPPEA